MMRVWLVTGASSGFGAALVQAVRDHGDEVIATSRDGSAGVRLDVTDPVSIRAAVADARVDVLVNNAGYGLLGAFEELTEADLREAFETNLFGALAVTRAVLPRMRERGSGHIVQMSSVIGVVAGPGGSAYAGPKAALEAMSESLAAEVAPFGIGVTIVEPGAFRTDFSGRSLRVADSHPAYADRIAPAAAAFRNSHGTQPGDPYRGAQAIIAAVESPDPPLRLPLGAEAFPWLRTYFSRRLEELDATEPLGADTAFRT